MLHDLKVLLANSRVILPILSWCNFILYFRCRESWGVEILPRHSKFLSKYGVFIGIINNYNFSWGKIREKTTGNCIIACSAYCKVPVIFFPDGYFIHEPRVTNRLGLRTQTFLIDPTELTTPASNRFSAYLNASLRE